MSSLEVKPWEATHPLNGNPCPVTGRIPYIEDTWKIIRPDYRLRTGILERGVMLSFPVGYTKFEDTINFFRNLKLICKSTYLDASNFVLIEDYSFHSGSDYDGRLQYIKKMVDEINPAGIVFFTRAANWRLAVRMAKVMGGNPFPILLAKSYREALQQASLILGRPIDGMHNTVAENNISNEHFSLILNFYSSNFVIAHYSGFPHSEDVSSIIEIFQRLPENPNLTENFIIVHDFSNMQKVSFSTFLKFLKLVLSNNFIDIPIAKWVVCKSPFIRFLMIARKLIYNSKHNLRFFSSFHNADKAIKTIDSQKTFSISEKSLQQNAYELIEMINWEKPGCSEFESVSDPQLKNLSLVLGALKQDVELYLAQRKREEEQLEKINQRAIRFSIEIEESLRHSEEDRLKVEQLAKDNIAMSYTISQSQKEVFRVLADYVDKRAGLNVGHTRQLAELVERIAPFFGYGLDEQERLHDATLLYHIGYLGIPECDVGNITHCTIGGQVLGNMNALFMKFASQIAKSHHELWNGCGYPEKLSDENIPKEARLVSLAEFILLNKDDSLERRLADESGIKFDPDMVNIILSNFNLILAWKDELSKLPVNAIN